MGNSSKYNKRYFYQFFDVKLELEETHELSFIFKIYKFC